MTGSGVKWILKREHSPRWAMPLSTVLPIWRKTESLNLQKKWKSHNSPKSFLCAINNTNILVCWRMILTMRYCSKHSLKCFSLGSVKFYPPGSISTSPVSFEKIWSMYKTRFRGQARALPLLQVWCLWVGWVLSQIQFFGSLNQLLFHIYVYTQRACWDSLKRNSVS